MKQIATLDSSFWINAHRAGLLSPLLDRFDLRYAPAVAGELQDRFPSGREFWRLVREGALQEAVPVRTTLYGFGPGERAAINLALEHRDWWLLIDDRRPLEEAQRMGLATVCSPVLVTLLFQEGTLNAGQALHPLARLTALHTVSPVFIEAALAQLGELWDGQEEGAP